MVNRKARGDDCSARESQGRVYPGKTGSGRLVSDLQ
jgi:hypothetical protein